MDVSKYVDLQEKLIEFPLLDNDTFIIHDFVLVKNRWGKVSKVVRFLLFNRN